MQRVIKAVLAAVACCVIGQAAHAVPIFEVDFQTGGVYFRGDPPNWNRVDLSSKSGLLVAENAVLFTDWLVNDAPYHLRWADYSGYGQGSEPIFGGNVVNVSGLRLPTGAALLRRDLTCWFVWDDFYPARAEIHFVNIPEPSAATMIFAAMGAAIAWRRRRGRE